MLQSLFCLVFPNMLGMPTFIVMKPHEVSCRNLILVPLAVALILATLATLLCLRGFPHGLESRVIKASEY